MLSLEVRFLLVWAELSVFIAENEKLWDCWCDGALFSHVYSPVLQGEAFQGERNIVESSKSSRRCSKSTRLESTLITKPGCMKLRQPTLIASFDLVRNPFYEQVWYKVLHSVTHYYSSCSVFGCIATGCGALFFYSQTVAWLREFTWCVEPLLSSPKACGPDKVYWPTRLLRRNEWILFSGGWLTLVVSYRLVLTERGGAESLSSSSLFRFCHSIEYNDVWRLGIHNTMRRSSFIESALENSQKGAPMTLAAIGRLFLARAKIQGNTHDLPCRVANGHILLGLADSEKVGKYVAG